MTIIGWIYRDGTPLPLTWCGRCKVFHIDSEHVA